MTTRDLTTLQLVWRESADTFHVRDPFPVGGVVEDPATGAAAAALGAYLREQAAVPAIARLTLHQGDDMGRPGILTVELVENDPRVRVSGTAVPIPARRTEQDRQAGPGCGSDLVYVHRPFVGTPGQIDAELFGGAEDVLVGVAHLDGHAVAGEHLDVEAQ
jgi:hypothetical protein